MSYTKKTLSAENMYTDSIYIPARSYVSVSIHPTVFGIANVSIQKAYIEEQTTWLDTKVQEMVVATGDIERVSLSPTPEDCLYRVGIPTGEYTSGTFICRLGSDGGA